MYICCRESASVSHWRRGSSSPTRPSTSLGCEVNSEILLALRDISARTELLDRVQPDLTLRRGAQG